MNDKPRSETIEFLLGREDISTLVHEASRRELSNLLEKQLPITVPNFSRVIEHQVYEKTRGQLAETVAIGVIINSNHLDNLVNQWIDLQRGYSRQIIQEAKAGVKDQKDLLEVCNKQLSDGENDRSKFATLSQKKISELGAEGIARYQALSESITKLDRIASEAEQLQRSIDGVVKIEQTLNALIDSGVQCIHYVIPSLKQIQERLGKNTYTGPDFSPFLVSSNASATDIFMRTTSSAIPRVADGVVSTNLEELPQTLTELVKVYEHISSRPNGETIVPSNIVTSLGLEVIGAKGLASYLEDNGPTFSVEKKQRTSGSRTFTKKEPSRRLDNKSFIVYMVDGHLQGPDGKEVNEFYFQKALGELREKPEAYLGFTKETIRRIVESKAWLLGRIYIARNLTTRNDLGIERITEDRYKFSEVIPTELQLRYVKVAVEQFGGNRFSPKDVLNKIHEENEDYRTILTVVDTSLDKNHKTWGLRIASSDPLQYQKIDRPAGAERSTARPIGRLI